MAMKLLLAAFCITQLHAASAIDAKWIPGPGESAPTVVVIGADVNPRNPPYNLFTIPQPNPDGEKLVFPPPGIAYRQNGQSHFIWRWLLLHAPDLVVVAGDQDYGVPAIHVHAGDNILHAIPKQIALSDAHREMARRLKRTPHEVAEELAKFYGHDFDQPVYIPAMALISRVRLGQRADVETLVAPYLDGRKDSLAKATSSHLAGHLIFAELGDMDRVRAAADLAIRNPMDNQMSDSVFMNCPILASAGYFDKALQHLRTMQKLCLRPDGLYRHSPLNEAAWGRGNAFPALGLSWTLMKTPQSDPAFAPMLKSFQDHVHALEEFQDRDGMWHEIIDQPGSYAEFSATAMIATAMLRGVRHGWLDRKYDSQVQAAWRGLLARIGPNGELLDVCESTGKQKTLEDYLNRAASFGKDARGGGMAMLLATELDEAGVK